MINDLLWKLLGGMGIQKEGVIRVGNWDTATPQAPVTSNPVSEYKAPATTPAYQAPQTPTLDENSLVNMINVYGGEDAPLHSYKKQLADATQYDFWKNNPELLALIPHLETSSGRYVTRPNNLTNWGINYPGNNEAFAKMTPEQVLERFITGMAERDSNYKDFRTGAPLTDEQLLQLAKTYEPANSSYGQNLVEGRKHIRNSMNWPSL